MPILQIPLFVLNGDDEVSSLNRIQKQKQSIIEQNKIASPPVVLFKFFGLQKDVKYLLDK